MMPIESLSICARVSECESRKNVKDPKNTHRGGGGNGWIE